MVRLKRILLPEPGRELHKLQHWRVQRPDKTSVVLNEWLDSTAIVAHSAANASSSRLMSIAIVRSGHNNPDSLLSNIRAAV
jgi:hypothetical protein